MQPGEALELINFEPDINGGYRRINGFAKYNTNVVPQTSASTEEVLLSCIFNDKIVAARGEKIFTASAGSGSWTERQSGRTSAGVYTFERFNFDGTDKLIVADGANAPTVFNTSFSPSNVAPSKDRNRGSNCVTSCNSLRNNYDRTVSWYSRNYNGKRYITVW